MSPPSDDPPSVDPLGLPPDRCPNCGAPLRRLTGQPESFCPSCEIFVEIVGPRSPPAEESAEDNEVRLRSARLYLELDDLLSDELEELPEAPPDEPPPETRAEAVESEAVPEPELTLEEAYEALEVTEVPEIVVPVPPEPLPSPEAEAEEVPEVAVAVAKTRAAAAAKPRAWHRVLFYTGSVLIAFGGSGLALGSFLHDMFRVPLFGYAYDAFGDVNVTTALIGAAILLAGLAAMAVGARAGSHVRAVAEG